MSKDNTQINILIVDDSKINRNLIEIKLQHQGFQCTAVETGQEAIDIINSDQKPDLILLDLIMPGINGLQVLEKVRQRHSMVDLPIIIVSANNEGNEIIQALHLGANDYISKPINFYILSARIETHLNMQQLALQNKDFIAIASHDLRKPLVLIQDIIQTLQEEIHSTPPQMDNLDFSLELIAETANYLNEIAEGYLDLQAMNAGSIQLVYSDVNMHQLVKDVLSYNSHNAEKKSIQLITKMPPTPIIIYADYTRISQVLDNFVSNAIKFCSAQDQISIQLYQQESLLLVEVKDNGPGLSEDDLQRVFIKFARLQNQPTGGEKSVGLGLSICKQIIELHHGKIGVRNNMEEKGATFWFSLPLQETQRDQNQ